MGEGIYHSTTVCLSLRNYHYNMFIKFESGSFKIVKILMNLKKGFVKIRSSVLQSRCPGCMLPFSYKTVYGIDVSLHLLHKDKCYCITRKSPLYQCVCHTTSGGRHFTPNSKDDCLPCFLFSIPITLLVFSLIGFNYLCTSKY